MVKRNADKTSQTWIDNFLTSKMREVISHKRSLYNMVYDTSKTTLSIGKFNIIWFVFVRLSISGVIRLLDRKQLSTLGTRTGRFVPNVEIRFNDDFIESYSVGYLRIGILRNLQLPCTIGLGRCSLCNYAIETHHDQENRIKREYRYDLHFARI